MKKVLQVVAIALAIAAGIQIVTHKTNVNPPIMVAGGNGGI